MNKKNSLFFKGLFMSLFLLAVLTILLPAKTVSPTENRVLAQRPVLTAERIANGSFQTQLSNFLSDQIPFRTGWIRLNTVVKKAMGRRKINGVYLGDDHRYFSAFTDDDYASSRMLSVFRMLEAFQQEAGIPASVMLVPSPGTILAEDLPNHAPYYDAEPVYAAAKQLLSCDVLDLRQIFADSDTDLYYHTDHHWTTRGAELAYAAYAEAAGLPRRSFALQSVSDSFFGTLDSRVLDPAAVPDSIEAMELSGPVRITFGDGSTADSPYFTEKLAEKDQYSYFFGGNHGIVTIETDAGTGKNLLVLKDSFANSFVPFLFVDYSKIVLLDLRYFDGSAAETVRQEQITDLLVLYETSNFLTDSGILNLQK